MLRLQFVLIAALVLSALGLVTSQHQARRLFVDVERAQGHMRQLETDWNQLQLEQSSAAKHALIDARAQRELRMVPVTPARSLYIDLNGPAAQAPAPGAQP